MERGSDFRERVVVPWRYTWQLPDGERGRQAEGPGSCWGGSSVLLALHKRGEPG